MDTLIGIAVVGVWIAVSVTALKRAYRSRGPLPNSPPDRHANRDIRDISACVKAR
jgi:hypothetical protein